MKICPECEKTFDDETKFCPDDGTPLKPKGQNQDPMMGRRLMDRWEVIDRIGAGGFGTVYKVRDLRFDYMEALKVFDRRRLNPEEVDEAVARFRREAMLLKRLGNLSQHIVGVSNMEDDQERGFIYFTMEFVDGENLSQILVREGALPPDRVVAITKQICKALSVAHGYEEGIVHRDLKLENVMITRDKNDREVVKILDFGIAKAIGQQSLTNLDMGGPGTPGYAAPEQVEGGEIDQRTDLFALGVVIYGMMTGREPWLGGFITEPSSGGWTLIKQTVDGDPIPAHRWDPEVPKALEDICFKLLEKEKDDRFQSADEVWEALDAFESGKAVPAPAKGTLRVLHDDPGVAIRVKQGVFKTIAEGRTPWEAGTLEPGTYTIQIRDDRYEKESREVEVLADGVVEVNLTAAKVGTHAERPGSVLVEADREDVRVRLRSGLKSLGEGTTPWSASGLPPGDYKVEVVDDRFARTSRSVRVVSEEETKIRLSIADKSDIPIWKRAAQSPAAIIVLVAIAATAVGVSVLTGNVPVRSVDEFEQHIQNGEVLDYRVVDGEIRARVEGEESDLDVVVPLGGEPLQEKMRQYNEQAGGDLLRLRGEGSLVFQPQYGDGGPSITPVRFTLRSQEGEGEVCSGCEPGQPVTVASGWYEVTFESLEWDPDDVRATYPEDDYLSEILDRDQLVFVPEDDQVQLEYSLAPTELGRTLGRAEEALGRETREALDEARSWIREALQTHPEHAAALALRDSVAAGYVRLGQQALAQGDGVTAGELAQACESMEGGERPECSDLLQSAQTQLAQASEPEEERGPATGAETDPDAVASGESEAAPEDSGPTQAERYAQEATRALDAGELNEARQAVSTCAIVTADAEPCVQARTRLVAAYEDRARSRLDGGDLDQASEAVRNCLSLDAGSTGCIRVRAGIAFERGEAALEAGELAEAVDYAGECRRDNPGGTAPDCGSLVRRVRQVHFQDARDALAENRLPATQSALDRCAQVEGGSADCQRVRRALTNLRDARTALSGDDFSTARSLANQCLREVSDVAPCQQVIEDADREEAAAQAAAEPPEPEPEPEPTGPTAEGLGVEFGVVDQARMTVTPSFSTSGASTVCGVFTFLAPNGYSETRKEELGGSGGTPFEVDLDELPRSTNQGKLNWDVTFALYAQACGQAPEEAGQGSPIGSWQGRACYEVTFGGEWYKVDCEG